MATITIIKVWLTKIMDSLRALCLSRSFQYYIPLTANFKVHVTVPLNRNGFKNKQEIAEAGKGNQAFLFSCLWLNQVTKAFIEINTNKFMLLITEE